MRLCLHPKMSSYSLYSALLFMVPIILHLWLSTHQRRMHLPKGYHSDHFLCAYSFHAATLHSGFLPVQERESSQVYTERYTNNLLSGKGKQCLAPQEHYWLELYYGPEMWLALFKFSQCRPCTQTKPPVQMFILDHSAPIYQSLAFLQLTLKKRTPHDVFPNFPPCIPGLR